MHKSKMAAMHGHLVICFFFRQKTMCNALFEVYPILKKIHIRNSFPTLSSYFEVMLEHKCLVKQCFRLSTKKIHKYYSTGF